MFSALRKGSPIYVLLKEDLPELKIGKIESTTNPTYNGYYNGSQVMDINVITDNTKMEFKNIQASSTIADYNNAVIAESKELLLPEVENLLLNSKGIIDSVDYHNKVIERCEDMVKELNPRYAHQIELDNDISNLKSEIGGIKSKMDTIIGMLSKSDK